MNQGDPNVPWAGQTPQFPPAPQFPPHQVPFGQQPAQQPPQWAAQQVQPPPPPPQPPVYAPNQYGVQQPFVEQPNQHQWAAQQPVQGNQFGGPQFPPPPPPPQVYGQAPPGQSNNFASGGPPMNQFGPPQANQHQHQQPVNNNWPQPQHQQQQHGGGAAASGPLCTSCGKVPPNTGKKWCEGCYQYKQKNPQNNPQMPQQGSNQPQGHGKGAAQQPHHGHHGHAAAAAGGPMCSACNKFPPNKGFAWCAGCFAKSKNPQVSQPQPSKSLCANCNVNAPNPGHKWCQTCFQNQRNWSQNQHSGHHQHHNNQQLGQQHAHQHQHQVPPHNPHLCSVCQWVPPNKGFKMCEQCYQNQGKGPQQSGHSGSNHHHNNGNNGNGGGNASNPPHLAQSFADFEAAIAAGDKRCLKSPFLKKMVKAKNNLGENLVHVAAKHGELAILQELAVAGFKLTKRSTAHGMSALHLSAKRGHEKVVQYLVNQGVDRFQRDHWGYYAYDRAYRSPNMRKLLGPRPPHAPTSATGNNTDFIDESALFPANQIKPSQKHEFVHYESAEFKAIVFAMNMSILPVHSSFQARPYDAFWVESITRFNSAKRWKKFQAEPKNATGRPIWYLFHGTSQQTQFKIEKDQFKQSAIGTYGPAIYLAKNSSAAHLHAKKHDNTDGWHYMFLCAVNIGEHKTGHDVGAAGNNQTARHSVKASHDQSGAKLNAVVQWVPKGFSEVLVWKPERVYPLYRIQYKPIDVNGNLINNPDK